MTGRVKDSIQNDRTDEVVEPTWSSSKRFWVSCILAFHVGCVCLAPLAVVEPRPALALDIQRLVHPYAQSLFLEHGYRFFAPEPGPSHILRFDVTNHAGLHVTGQFPERGRYWPRLLYHRWFMLSETVFQHVSETLDEKQLADWKQQINDEIRSLVQEDPRAAAELEIQLGRELAEHDRLSATRDRLITDIGKMLLRKHEGVSVKLELVTRVIPQPQDVARGVQLDNSRYLPTELQYDLGTVYSDSDQLESIAPREAEQGRGVEPK